MKLPSLKFKVSKKIIFLSGVVLMTAAIFVIVKQAQKPTTPEPTRAETCPASEGHLHFVVAEPLAEPTLAPTPTPTLQPVVTPTPQPTEPESRRPEPTITQKPRPIITRPFEI